MNGLRIRSRVPATQAPDEAPALVLVHGLVVSSRYMVPLIATLAPHYRVFAPDLPGFGRSDRPERVLDVAGLAGSLASWMHAAGLERPVLLGHSFGCQVVVELALSYPDLPGRAVLVGPSGDPRNRDALRQSLRLAVDITREPLSTLPIMIGDFLAAGPLRSLRTFQYYLEDPVERKLPHLRLPVLVVRGSRDPIAPARWAEEIARRVPGALLATIPSTPHAVHFTDPGLLLRAIQPFLDEAGAQPRVGREERAA